MKEIKYMLGDLVRLVGGGRRMKKKYSFANAKPVLFGKIDYWFRVGQCGCHKTDYKPNLRDKRKFMAELRRDSNIMIKIF